MADSFASPLIATATTAATNQHSNEPAVAAEAPRDASATCRRIEPHVCAEEGQWGSGWQLFSVALSGFSTLELDVQAIGCVDFFSISRFPFYHHGAFYAALGPVTSRSETPQGRQSDGEALLICAPHRNVHFYLFRPQDAVGVSSSRCCCSHRWMLWLRLMTTRLSKRFPRRAAPRAARQVTGGLVIFALQMMGFFIACDELTEEANAPAAQHTEVVDQCEVQTGTRGGTSRVLSTENCSSPESRSETISECLEEVLMSLALAGHLSRWWSGLSWK
ncbi:hypothetical protein EYF80_017535 [Liparis tanakae]|uniref:Uncharacterized protein n=1 Tax=Liparis tanakae TaxID=230148 RepID=A0A4Z2I3A8_9TELE|nr:hypothetical protein EYF80_017535 [Liparis tanakae]